MATTEVPLHSVAGQHSTHPARGAGAWLCAGLTALVLLVHGYHPYAEDGGVYLAGIKRVLNPRLYPHWTGFVTTHLKFSLFAPSIAVLVRGTHLDLMTVLLFVYVGATWLTLIAGWLLISRCTVSLQARAAAVSLLALALTIPVAGTSLMLMDPYVTARSISTPCGILMLVLAVDLDTHWKQRRTFAWRSAALFAVTVAIAAAMHPLMAAYALGCAALLACASMRNARAGLVTAGVLCVLAICLAGIITHFAPAATPAYGEVARSRTYWFPAMWQWYELLGLAGPILVLLLAWPSGAGRRLSVMAAFAGTTAIVVAALFAHVDSRSFAVARLQPLRIYQTIYLLMLLALGAAIGERLLKHSIVRWAAMFLVVGGAMAFVQRQTFPHSAHTEQPWQAPANQWTQAFQWIRSNTPEDAAFALDANYTSAPGEDSQNFRAIAERSAMPDYAKDGGIASIAPALTSQWTEGVAAQTLLDRGVTFEQAQRLRSAGVNWIVIPRDTPVSFTCKYASAAVKVCPLP